MASSDERSAIGNAPIVAPPPAAAQTSRKSHMPVFHAWEIEPMALIAKIFAFAATPQRIAATNCAWRDAWNETVTTLSLNIRTDDTAVLALTARCPRLKVLLPVRKSKLKN